MGGLSCIVIRECVCCMAIKMTRSGEYVVKSTMISYNMIVFYEAIHPQVLFLVFTYDYTDIET